MGERHGQYPHRTPDGLPVTVVLDWSSRSHWGGGTPRPCRRCRRPALLVDEEEQPCHKSCAEYEHQQSEHPGLNRDTSSNSQGDMP